MMSSRRSILALLVCVGFCLGSTVTAGVQEDRDGVFIHLTHGVDDPHRVLMALSMATMMSEDHDVLVYFDINGIEVVLKDADDVTHAHFVSSKEQLAALSRKGVTLMACPGCLKAAGKTAADLATGIVTADKKAFFNFTQGRILSLDY